MNIRTKDKKKKEVCKVTVGKRVKNIIKQGKQKNKSNESFDEMKTERKTD
jgi:hypothetical protein